MTLDAHNALLTQCPHCATVFRLNAAVLAAARGFVECGECNRVFFSLERIADEPPNLAPAPLASGMVLPRVLMHPRPDVDEMEPGPRITEPTPLAPEAQAVEEIPLDDIPPILREDVERRRHRKQAKRQARWALRWMRFATALLLLFALQVGWGARMLLMERYPVLGPWIDQLCTFAGCRARLALPPPDVALLARDVREHPLYKGSLLVNATLLNREPRAAAYPVLELAIYDDTGTLLGVRRFKPAEYLDASVDLPAGMPPSRAVQVVLEIANVSERAAGFEFSFR